MAIIRIHNVIHGESELGNRTMVHLNERKSNVHIYVYFIVGGMDGPLGFVNARSNLHNLGYRFPN